MRRGQTGLSALIAVDKPTGITSHDVVSAVRRIYGERRVGHAGTLDPMASGLLVVGIGPAARLSAFLSGDVKSYRARIVFGASTDTDDAQGSVIQTAAVPDEVRDPFTARDFVASLIGPCEQVPPAYSAIKREGRKAYERARSGEDVVLEPRSIRIINAVLEGIGTDAGGVDYWDVLFEVSKGTYIRALARDIGAALGTCAHLGALRRLRSGTVGIEQALTLDQLEETALDDACIDPVGALGLRCARVDDHQARLARNGAKFKLRAFGDELASADLLSLVHEGRLIAVYHRDGAIFRPQCVLSQGVQGVS